MCILHEFTIANKDIICLRVYIILLYHFEYITILNASFIHMQNNYRITHTYLIHILVISHIYVIDNSD